MNSKRSEGESIRTYLIEHVAHHPADIVRVVAEKFTLSRQAVHKHLRKLIAEGIIASQGRGRGMRYVLVTQVHWQKKYRIGSRSAEDAVWRADIAPQVQDLPANVREIWSYAFMEMFNNVIDHSGSTTSTVMLSRTAAATTITIADNGVGIFKKIQAALGLMDERHAVLELAKGKVTTDPTRHSGEGIFFSSRMFDSFDIISGDVCFSHVVDKREDWIDQNPGEMKGTLVCMSLRNDSPRTLKRVFDSFSSEDEYAFVKTVVPVRLIQYGDDFLVSRSQAKRLLARLDRFRVVSLDFQGVESIGQAFADEVFRVFRKLHPNIEITFVNASSAVKRMISRALAASENP